MSMVQTRQRRVHSIPRAREGGTVGVRSRPAASEGSASSVRTVPSAAQNSPIAGFASPPRGVLLTRMGARALAFDLAAWVVAVAGTGLIVGSLSLVWVAVTLALWLLGMLRQGAYNDRTSDAGSLPGSTLFGVAGRALVFLAIASMVLSTFSPTPYLALVVALIVTTAVARRVYAGWLGRRRAEGVFQAPVVVRGPAADIEALVVALAKDHTQPFKVAALQATSGSLASGNDHSCHEDPVEIAQEHGASAVILVGAQPETPDELRRMVWQMEAVGVEAVMVPLLSAVAAPKALKIGNTGVPAFRFEGRDFSPERSVLRTLIDFALTGLVLLLLSPLMVTIAVAIKLDSTGPVFFRQVRVGRNGRRFTMYKYRTMRVGADKEQSVLDELNVHEGGTLFKIRDDPRVTRLGRKLRRYSLDELPQLFNVLLGEMSLIGPRPPLPSEVANYPVDLHRRFVVRPGLTGLWQVSGRSDLDPHESGRLDVHYVEHWSPALDLQIFLKTVKVVLAGDGAY